MTIIEFDGHSLIVYHTPLALNGFSFTVFAAFTKESFCFEAFENIYFVSIVFSKIEFVIFIDQLNFIWNRMRTNLLRVEQVYDLFVGADFKEPFTEERFTKAVHRLIG